MRFRTAVASIVASALLAVLAVAPADALIIRPDHRVQFSVPVAGTAKPYSLKVDVQHYGSNALLDLRLTRHATSGNRPVQEHAWSVDGVSFTCTDAARRCVLETGTTMASYGHLHLVFNATSQPTTVQKDCPTDLGYQNTEARRSGKVTGTFELNTGTGYFGTITNSHATSVHVPASIHATATKYTYGGQCPPRPSSKCEKQVFMGILGGSSGVVSAYESPNRSRGSVLWTLDDPRPGPDVLLVHRIYGVTSATVVKITSNSPSALTSMSASLPIAPFITGSGTFSGSGNPTHPSFPGCRETDRDGTFTGTWTVHLDGYGKHVLNGGVPATASRFVPN